MSRRKIGFLGFNFFRNQDREDVVVNRCIALWVSSDTVYEQRSVQCGVAMRLRSIAITDLTLWE